MASPFHASSFSASRPVGPYSPPADTDASLDQQPVLNQDVTSALLVDKMRTHGHPPGTMSMEDHAGCAEDTMEENPPAEELVHEDGTAGAPVIHTQPQLTDTVLNGVQTLEARKASIDKKIEEMTRIGVEFLDRLKASFVEKMNSYKESISHHCKLQEESWQQLSAETIHNNARLQSAQELVKGLGINAGAAELMALSSLMGHGNN